MKIDKNGILPRYFQLKEILKEQINSGKLNVGDRIPSQNELMQGYKLSYATVSRALGELGNEGLVYREHGRGSFVADPTRIDKAGEKTKNIGIGLYDLDYISQPYFSTIVKGVGKVVETYNYNLQLSTTAPHQTGKANGKFYRKMVDEKKIDGFVIIDHYLEDRELLRLKKKGVPFVLIDRYIPGVKANSILVDNTDAFYQATEYLLKLGHQKIGLALGGTQLPVDKDRLQGYILALKKYNLHYDKKLIVDFFYSREERRQKRMIENLLKTTSPPSAIIVCSDSIAIMVARIIKNEGFRIPEDISLLIFGSTLISASMEPPMTSLEVPLEKIGELAGEMLLKLINKEVVKDNEIIVKPKLVIRESCREER